LSRLRGRPLHEHLAVWLGVAAVVQIYIDIIDAPYPEFFSHNAFLGFPNLFAGAVLASAAALAWAISRSETDPRRWRAFAALLMVFALERVTAIDQRVVEWTDYDEAVPIVAVPLAVVALVLVAVALTVPAESRGLLVAGALVLLGTQVLLIAMAMATVGETTSVQLLGGGLVLGGTLRELRAREAVEVGAADT
jgi:hypothetical protein